MGAVGRVWLAALTLGALGCQGQPPEGLCDGAYCPGQRSVRYLFQESINRKVDLLFLLDDTAAMTDARERLRASLPRMASVLENLPDGPLSLHVAFASASTCGSAGEARGAACGLSSPGGFLVSEWCNRVSNYAGSIGQTFACLGDLSPQDCGPAQPLDRLQALLARGENDPGPLGGFLRPEASLQIVIVAGEDDASAAGAGLAPVSEAVTFIRSLKVDPASQVLLTVIAPGRCPSGPSTDAPPRLRELLAAFGGNALFYPLCAEDFSPALQLLAERLAILVGLRCLPGIADADPQREGLQAACAVVDRVTGRDGTVETRILPGCDVRPPPCWSLTEGAPATNLCGVGTSLFQIQREEAFCRDAAVTTEVECLSTYP